MKQNLLIPLSLLLVIVAVLWWLYEKKKEVHLPPPTPPTPPTPTGVPFYQCMLVSHHMYNIILLIIYMDGKSILIGPACHLEIEFHMQRLKMH